MPKDAKLPDRFAKLVIAELADIHAIILTLADFAIADLVTKTGVTLEEAKAVFEAKRKPRAERYASELLARLRLDG
jgi:hypothetical protein